MEGDVFVEVPEERDAVTDQDRQDRIAQFIGESEAQALGGDRTASSDPDGTEPRPQLLSDQLGKIA